MAEQTQENPETAKTGGPTKPEAKPEPPEDWIAVIRPQPGQLLLFPSYYYHRTLPFEGAGERISISFDLAPAQE